MPYFPSGSVDSVNGQSGTVVLSGANVQPINAGDITNNLGTANVIGSVTALGMYGEVLLRDTDVAGSVVRRNPTFGWSIVTPQSGTTAQRPTPAVSRVGQMYFDTTLLVPIFWTGFVWMNAQGIIV